jgi:hypothetical protein
MRRFILAAIAAVSFGVLAAPAQAVSVAYCQDTLRQPYRTALAPDDDVKYIWDAYQAQGWRPTSSYWTGTPGRSGEHFVYVDRIYWFYSGYSTVHRFYCSDNRPSGGDYHDDHWYRVR